MRNEGPGRVFRSAAKPSPKTRTLVFDPSRGEGEGEACNLKKCKGGCNAVSSSGQAEKPDLRGGSAGASPCHQ